MSEMIICVPVDTTGKRNICTSWYEVRSWLQLS